MPSTQWILQRLSGQPGACPSARLDFIFLLFKLSFVMNGSLGDLNTLARTDLKNVLLATVGRLPGGGAGEGGGG